MKVAPYRVGQHTGTVQTQPVALASHMPWAFTTKPLFGTVPVRSPPGRCKSQTLLQAISRLPKDKVQRQQTGQGEWGREGSQEDLQGTKSFQSSPNGSPPGWEGGSCPKGPSPCLLTTLLAPLPGCWPTQVHAAQPRSLCGSSREQTAKTSTVKTRDAHKYGLRKPSRLCRELGLHKPFSPGPQHPAHCPAAKEVLHKFQKDCIFNRVFIHETYILGSKGRKKFSIVFYTCANEVSNVTSN